MIFRALLATFALTCGLFAQNPDWTTNRAPFHIVGNVYYVGSKDLASYLIVTPQGDILINSNLASSVPQIRKNIEMLGFKFSDVKILLISHAHFDHAAGSALLKRLTGAPVLYNQNDLPLVKMMDVQASWLGIPTPEVLPPDIAMTDGQSIGVEGIKGTVLHTPGHTQGSSCLYLPEQSVLLAGDTLFAGSVGRTDLPGGDQRKLLNSIRGRLMDLPEQTRVVPGHGHLTTIGKENDTNPWMTKGPIAKS